MSATRIKYLALLLFFLISNLAFTQIKIEKSIIEGKNLIINNEFFKAIQKFNQIIQAKPNSHLSYFYRGVAKLQLDDLTGAESDFSKTILIHPGYSDALYYLAITKLERHNYYDAQKNLNEALLLKLDPDYYVALGYIKLLINDTIDAICYFDTAISLDAKHPSAYLNRSIAKTSMLDYHGALEDCNKAIQLNKFNMQAFINRGKINYMMKDTAKAIEDYEYVITKAPENAIAYYYLATLYHEEEEYDKALYYYDKVIEINPVNALCLFNRAVLKSHTGAYNEAIADYDGVIRLNPENILTYFNRASAKYNIEDYNSAEEDLSAVIRIYPDLVDAYINRSSIRLKLNNIVGYSEDKLRAEELMSRDSLYKGLEIDSLYANKIFEFKTDFNLMDDRGGKIQYKKQQVDMLPLFQVTFQQEGLKQATMYNEVLSEMNAVIESPTDLIIDNTNNTLNQSADKLLNRIDTLISFNKKEYKYYLWKAILYGMLQNYNKAEEAIERAIILSDRTYMVHFVYANLQYFLGELLNSLEHQEQKVIGINDNEDTKPIGISGLNNLYISAIREYTKTILLKPDFAYAYYNRAYVKSMMNDLNGALTDYSMCVSIDKTIADAYFNRGLLYLFIGDITNACKDISKAGELGIKESYNVIYRYCE